MKQYCLKIKSKNQKSLKNFLYFFFKHSKNQSNIPQKLITLRTNQKMFTLLKSPHVNKTAQEHFESNLFKKKLLTREINLKNSLVFLKKIFSKLFHNVYVSLEFTTNKNFDKKNILLVFTPNNSYFFQNKPFKTNLKRNKQKTMLKRCIFEKNLLIKLLKVLIRFSVFGETKITFCIKKRYSLNSSVGRAED